MKKLLTGFRGLLSTERVRVSVLNGVSTMIRMLAGLVSTKVVATIVGPGGIALLGQLNNFSTIVLSLANGGITTGVTKYVSEHAGEDRKITEYLSTAFRITLLFSIACGIFMIIGAGFLSELILKEAGHAFVFYVFGFTIILYAFNALLLAILNGYKAYAQFVRVNIYSSIVGLFFTVVMALVFGLNGALVAVVSFQSVVFLITLKHAAGMPWFSWSFLKTQVQKKVVMDLLQYSLMAISTALIIPISQLVVRSHLVESVSVTDAGIWEGVNRISAMYLQVVTVSLSVYYLPKLSELKSDYEVRREVIAVYKLVIPFLLVATAGIYLFRDLIVSILFTSEFYGMRDLFLYQLAGDLLKMCGWVLGFIMVARAMTKTYIFMEFLNYAIFVILSYVLVHRYGVVGTTMAYAIGHAVYLTGMLFIFRKILVSGSDRS